MNSKNRKKHILVPLISTILIVNVGMLNIDFYFKSVIIKIEQTFGGKNRERLLEKHSLPK